jgi:hypothetical protein
MKAVVRISFRAFLPRTLLLISITVLLLTIAGLGASQSVRPVSGSRGQPRTTNTLSRHYNNGAAATLRHVLPRSAAPAQADTG